MRQRRPGGGAVTVTATVTLTCDCDCAVRGCCDCACHPGTDTATDFVKAEPDDGPDIDGILDDVAAAIKTEPAG